MTARLFHNPRCSKSRQALALLQESKVQFEILEYLKTPLEETDLLALFKKLDKAPIEIVRKGEAVFKELSLSTKELSLKEWASVIAQNPILLERPIFDNGSKAVIGRPPEDILSLI
ncbi:MAG: arsenate reductase [Bacteriovoracaceae bacterium]|jgi:arsenate reductase